MALTKVNRGGLNTGISDSSNATFLTVDSSEQAVIKTENGATTTSVQSGLAKQWANFDPNTSNTITNSLNVASLSDNGTGDYALNNSSNFDDGFFVRIAGTAKAGGSPSGTNYTTGFSTESTSASTLGVCTVGNGGGSGPSAVEYDQTYGIGHGDLA